MKSLHKYGIGQLIENQSAPSRAARLALDPTPLRALAIAAAGATPGGAACARHSLPLCVRPSLFFGHPEGEN